MNRTIQDHTQIELGEEIIHPSNTIIHPTKEKRNERRK